MRVINQITFTAKDDAEALRLASERLGRDAVILSSQIVKDGGVFGLFKHSVLRVTAGILEDDTQQTKPQQKQNLSSASSISNMDEDTRRENLIAFRRLLEFKEKGSITPPAPAPSELGNEGYMTDDVQFSREGIAKAERAVNAYNNNAQVQPQIPAPQPQVQQTQNQRDKDVEQISKQVGALADRIDFLLERLNAVENMSRINNSVNNNIPEISVQPVQQQQIQTPQIQFQQTISGESEIEQRLRASEVDEKYIRKLTADYNIAKSREKNKKLSFTKWLGTKIECAADNGGDAVGGRRVMLIGPTGVGKTTTIAKLAAIKALWEHKRVLLLTSDTYRIAAVEQLKTYAKILGVPIEIIFDIASVPSIIEEHDNAEIILMDTAGRSQRDKKNMDMYVNLYNAFNPDAVHLVLAANMKYRDMLDVVEHIPDIPVSHLLFTKLDETVSYGSIFNIRQVMGCPVSFLTVGQNVPKDIETAEGLRIAELLMKSDDERKR